MMSSHLKKAAALLLPACTLLVLATNSSCYKDNKQDLYPAGACDTGTVTWTADIQPIINNSCTLSGCHDATASGGYNLTTYTGVKAIADNGRLLATTTSGSMPKNMAKLDDCSIAKLTRWVNTGAPNN